MANQYKALTFVNLPGTDKRVAPGGTITAADFEAAKQTEEDIQSLIDGGAISEDMDAELHPDHQDLIQTDDGEFVVMGVDTGDAEDKLG